MERPRLVVGFHNETVLACESISGCERCSAIPVYGRLQQIAVWLAGSHKFYPCRSVV